MTGLEASTDDTEFSARELEAPWYAGVPAFARSQLVQPDDVPAGSVAVVGLPIDEFATSSARSGMRWGPRRIREASLRAMHGHGVRMDVGSLDICTGRVLTWPGPVSMVDAGDAPVVHHDPVRQVALASDYISRVSRSSRVTVTLGGDHFAAYPAYLGVSKGWRTRGGQGKVGFLHIDSHTDFADERRVTGRLNHATCARRISELEGVHRMGWFGVNTPSEPNQFQVMHERHFRVFTASYIRRVGAEVAMRQMLNYVLDGVEALYVSIDIDVVNNAHAPGTGSAVFEGLTAQQLLEAMRVLAEVESLIGIDLCEVAPVLDSSWRTEMLASAAIMAALSPLLYRTVKVISPELLHEVFIQ